MSTRQGRIWLAAALSGALVLGGCDDATGPAGEGNVAIAFAARPAGSAQLGGSGSASLGAQDVVISGSNGTIRLEEVRLIVAEFELKRANRDDCDNSGPGDDDACEKFRSGPAFVNVPLDGGETVAVSSDVAPDVYEELEFEIEDLDDDEEDPAEAEAIRQLFRQIRDEIPDWPRDASLMLVGTFTRPEGAPEPFRVFFEAEIEVEMDLSPPLVVDEGDRLVTIEIDPRLWLRRADGRVLDLPTLDFDRTGRVTEFEVEIENGFVEVDF